VFLQFDGTRDDIYRTLRGRDLLETKLEAIRVCSELGVGVTLVPTVVKGVNDDNLGEIVRLAVRLAPGVRGIHFQPVSYFGRYPTAPEAKDRYTLDMLMTDIADQAGIPIDSFMPSRCDHPLCGFHASFLIESDGALKALSSITHSAHSRGCAKDNREYVARHWRRAPEEAVVACGMADYVPGRDTRFQDVFERADADMYENKKFLKNNNKIGGIKP
jgi:antitoxin component of RelBE/YafQ-DinJ toxin-antitoxin module